MVSAHFYQPGDPPSHRVNRRHRAVRMTITSSTDSGSSQGEPPDAELFDARNVGGLERLPPGRLP
jgi:hypothetical protein